MKTQRIMQARIFADKSKLSEEAWREMRRSGIGGSDAAAVVGLDPYKTPFALYADKTGALPECADNEAMRQGRDLEEYVASRWRERMAENGTPKRTKQCGFMLQHPYYPFMIANVDRLIVGEKAGLECKTTSVLSLRKFRGGEFPERYYVQCVHYMAVTGAARWYLAVLVLNKDLYVFTIERDEDEINALIAAECKFWQENVAAEVPPEPDGNEATKKALGAIYADDLTDEPIDLPYTEKLRELAELKAQRADIDKLIDERENAVKADMGPHIFGTCGPYTISWKPQSRTSFNDKAFAADHPQLDLSGYYKTTSFRKFDFKEIKEA